jgi:hypothetical protein
MTEAHHLGPTRAQAPSQFPMQFTSTLQVERWTDGLATELHDWITGKRSMQTIRYLVG